MFMRTRRIIPIVVIVMAFPLIAPLNGCAHHTDNMPLAQTFKAHGGLDDWRQQRTFVYTLNGFPLSPQVIKPNTSIVDLHRRYNRIEGVGFTVGFDGSRAWSVPGPDAVGLPPRFVSLGSFYFIGMPFVFGDDGIVLEDQGAGTFRGETYRMVRVSYAARVGYSSEDDYVAFIDPHTNRLALINHSVTETGVERVTWVFDEWQRVSGLLVPARMTFHAGWNPDDPGEGASFSIENVSFSAEAPDPAIYAPPPGAVIAD